MICLPDLINSHSVVEAAGAAVVRAAGVGDHLFLLRYPKYLIRLYASGDRFHVYLSYEMGLGIGMSKAI